MAVTRRYKRESLLQTLVLLLPAICCPFPSMVYMGNSGVGNRALVVDTCSVKSKYLGFISTLVEDYLEPVCTPCDSSSSHIHSMGIFIAILRDALSVLGFVEQLL